MCYLRTTCRRLLPVLLSLALPCIAAAAVIHVNPEGTGDYPAIQVAIAYAAEGDTILAAPGVYTGHFDKNLELRGKALTLMSSAGPESTVIDCQMDGRGFYVHEGEGPTTIIQGFTVTNGRAGCGGGMHCEGTSPTVLDVVFSHCEATDVASCGGGGAIYCNGGGSPTFATMVLFDNAAVKGGAFLTGGSTPTLSDCSIVGNSTGIGGSVQCGGGAITIENTVVGYDRTGGGIICTGYGIINATHCLVFANLGGSEICGYDIENLWESPLFCDWEAGDLGVCSDSPCLPWNNPYGVHIGARGESDCPCPERVVVEVPYDYSTIAEALEVVSYGDTVIVHPGVYYEDNLNLGAGVVLLGVAGRDSTVINAAGGGPAILIGYERGAGRSSQSMRSTDMTRVEGFTVTGATDSAIKIKVASPTISGCSIIGNTADSGGGIYCDRASPVLTDVLFLENEATLDGAAAGGGGLYCKSASPTLSSCIFWGNTAVRGGAIFCHDDSSPVVTNCTLSDNVGTLSCSGVFCRYSSPRIEHTVLTHGAIGSAVTCAGDSEPVITQCVVFWNDNTDEMCGSTFANVYEPPLFCDHASGDLTVCAESPCLPENNMYGVQIGALGLGECACPVGTTLSVPFDYATIGEALTAAGLRDTVLVYPGVYLEHGLSLEWAISLIGVAGPDSTVIDAQGNSTILDMDGHGGSRRERYAYAAAVRGFTVTGATGTAIRASNTSVTVTDCVITGNSGTSGGGMFTAYGGIVLEDCVFSGNTATWGGGGLYALWSLVEVTNCRFEGNSTARPSSSEGGAVMGDACSLQFASTDFIGNTATSGGGICSMEGSSLVVADCSFVGNDSSCDDPYEGGGAVYCYAETLGLISGSTFRGNSAFRGGAIHVRGGTSAGVTGCTFVENDSPSGSTAFVRGSTLGVDSAILAYGLGGTAVHCATNANIATHFCDVFGNAGGDSLCGEHSLNIFVDPAFCDTAGLRFYLQDCSPCVGAGAGGVDIGAWGVACPCGDASGTDEGHATSLALLGCAPNPSRAAVTVYFLAPGAARATLHVYDLSGRSVAEVAAETGPGLGKITWDGRSSRGGSVGSGVYFYELQVGGDSRRGRMVLLH